MLTVMPGSEGYIRLSSTGSSEDEYHYKIGNVQNRLLEAQRLTVSRYQFRQQRLSEHIPSKSMLAYYHMINFVVSHT